MTSESLTAVTLKRTFLDVALCSLMEVYDVKQTALLATEIIFQLGTAFSIPKECEAWEPNLFLS